MFKGLRQVRLMSTSTAKLQSGAPMSDVTDDIFAYYSTDPIFDCVLREFNATRSDIEAIIVGMMAAGAGATYRRHFVPVSGVLYPLTLSYLLRAHQGEVPKAD